MRFLAPILLSTALAAGLAGCAREEGQPVLPGGEDTQPFSAVSEEDLLRFTGTEPFWGGEVVGSRLTYRTPELPDGTLIEVERFAGRGGLSFSGMLGQESFDMAVTQGACSDGMSDRTYPLTVTLRIGAELRQGCGWTDRLPYEEPSPS